MRGGARIRSPITIMTLARFSMSGRAHQRCRSFISSGDCRGRFGDRAVEFSINRSNLRLKARQFRRCYDFGLISVSRCADVAEVGKRGAFAIS